MTRIPKVGEQGWKLHGFDVEIVAVVPDQAWVRCSGDVCGSTVWFDTLTPPEPTVTHLRYLWVTAAQMDPVVVRRDMNYHCAEARLERLSDGTWRVTNLKEDS
jgi:transglutaminase-like putative cysteine protease